MSSDSDPLPNSREDVDGGAIPLGDQVFDTLRGWIVGGTLAPGHRLTVRTVAEAVGSSAMPVRLAIRRLVEAGLATQEPYKGARVRGLNLDELTQAYDVRILIEPRSAQLGTFIAGPDVVAQMDEHWQALQDAARRGDSAEALHRDEAIFEALYACAGNAVLYDIVHGLWNKCRPYRALWAGGPDRQGRVDIWNYHLELIEAVQRNDGELAFRIVEETYVAAKLEVLDILNRKDWLFYDPSRMR